MFSAIFRRITPALLTLVAGAGVALGQASVTASPSSVTFTYPSTTPQSQQITLSSPTTGMLSVGVSAGLANAVSVPSTVGSNESFNVVFYPQWLTGPASGTITLTGSGFNTLSIPITVGTGGGTGTSNISASPSTVTFSYAFGTTAAQTQSVYLSAPATVALTPSLSTNLAGTVQVGSVSSNGYFTLTIPYPQFVSTTISGTLTLTPPAGSGLTALSIPITVYPGGTGGTGSFYASPQSLTFNYPVGTLTPQTQNVQLVAPTTVSVTPTLSSNLLNYVTVSGAPTTNSTIGVTVYPQFITTAISGTLTLTPTSGGLNIVQVPITITPGGTSTGGLTASPSSLTYTYFAGTTTPVTQYLYVTTPTGSQVALTPSFSTNVAPYFQALGSLFTGSQFAVTLASPQLVPAGTIGTLTLTPAAGSGLGAIQVPLYINTSGGGTGSGALVPTPSTLTFNVIGNTAPASQSVNITSATGTTQFFSAIPSSTLGFLSVSQSTFTTPATLTVRVDPTLLTQPGTYTGTINLQLVNGTTAGTISVTVNVAPNVTVTPNPASVTLSVASGGTGEATVNLGSTDTTVAFAATAASTTPAGSNWLSVTPASGNLGSAIRVRANAANLSTGTYTGSVTITVSGATVATIPVNLTVTPAATLTLSSTTLTFAHQTTSTTAPAAQTVQITTSGSSPLTWTATPTSNGGWLKVDPTTGSTPGTLNISIIPTGLSAGTYTGRVDVASSGASNSPQTVNVTLNVTTPALPVISSVVNAASFAPTVAVPGEIVTIRGTDLGPATGVSGTVDAQNMMSTTVGGVRVLFEGLPAPILYASATQINAIVPYEIANRVSTRMLVQYQGQNSRELELRVGDTAPGLFTNPSGGSGQGAILNQNGSVNSATNAERRGNVIVLYGTGQGQTTPAGTTGLVFTTPLRTPVAPVTVRIGGQNAEVLYAGSAPGFVSGALQVNARIPANVGTGNLPVEIVIGGVSSQAGVTVAVQ